MEKVRKYLENILANIMGKANWNLKELHSSFKKGWIPSIVFGIQGNKVWSYFFDVAFYNCIIYAKPMLHKIALYKF